MKVRNKGVYHGIIYDTNHWKQPIQVIGKQLVNDLMEYYADIKTYAYEELVITGESADVIQ